MVVWASLREVFYRQYTLTACGIIQVNSPEKIGEKIKMPDEDNQFTTTSTPLAAWLYSQGFKLLDVKIVDFPAVIIFQNSDALLKSARLWQTGQAEGNIPQFYDAYRMLLGKVKPSRLWKNP